MIAAFLQAFPRVLSIEPLSSSPNEWLFLVRLNEAGRPGSVLRYWNHRRGGILT